MVLSVEGQFTRGGEKPPVQTYQEQVSFTVVELEKHATVTKEEEAIINAFQISQSMLNIGQVLRVILLYMGLSMRLIHPSLFILSMPTMFRVLFAMSQLGQLY